MELAHSDGKLRVHYSDRLVTLLREVRQLSAFGFSVPAKIQQTTSTADKFYKYGVILKQVRCYLWHVHTCVYEMDMSCTHNRIHTINLTCSNYVYATVYE